MSDRLFFALWPDAALRAELACRLPPLLAGVDGRPQRPDQWHVTLEFLGAVAAGRQPALRQAAGRAALEPVVIEFDRVEHWVRPQVACLVATRVPAALESGVARLRAVLAEEGFAPDGRPFRPHVTLARKVRAAGSATLAEPVRWPASRFALVRSSTEPAGSRYEPVQWWNCVVDGG
jgi:RNA 2',3'-cyclic 3'-phosphodiesterase